MKVAFFHCRVMSNATKICESEDEVRRSFDEYINVMQHQLNTCKTSCKQMPITVTLIGRDESEQGKTSYSSTYCCKHRLSEITPTDLILEIQKKSRVTLQFERTVVLNKQAPIYDAISLLAEMGGYVGVLCGYSILCFTDYVFAALNKRLDC